MPRLQLLVEAFSRLQPKVSDGEPHRNGRVASGTNGVFENRAIVCVSKFQIENKFGEHAALVSYPRLRV
jgi:hypothetical protein